MNILSIPSLPLNNIKVTPYINFPPKTLMLLRQGTNRDSQIIVSHGQKIKRGQMIAKSHTSNSQVMHASIGGIVRGTKNFQFPGNLSDVRAIEINSGGEFSSFNQKKVSDDVSDEQKISALPMLSQEEFLKKIRESGIYSVDTGILFDYLSHKFSNTSVNNIIVNAIEFSPYHKLEEKILQLHMKEIVTVVTFLLNMFDNNMKCMINSNSKRNKLKFSWSVKNNIGVFPIAYSMQAINFDNDYTPADLHENYTLIAKGLAKKKFAIHSKQQENFMSAITVQDKSIILKPSVLLAIYELLMYEKPYIDIYIQMILGLDNVVIQRVPLGTPLLYLLAPYNKNWKEMPNHCFMGDFFHRKMLINKIAPITKDHVHYWLIQDSDFTKLYKRLKKWLDFSNSSV